MLIQVATRMKTTRAFSRTSLVARQFGGPRSKAKNARRNHGSTSIVAPTTQSNNSNKFRQSSWMTAGLIMALSSSTTVIASETTLCQEDDHDGDDDGKNAMTVPPFDESVIEYDHYNGVTLHLDKLSPSSSSSSSSSANTISEEQESALFAKNLQQAMNFWKAEQRKGIWVHLPTAKAHLVQHCVKEGFDFHFVKDKILILSQWLPQDKPSKLPLGPSHQVGIGAVVLHPKDPSKMLVVQEKSGPAAKWKLWKMPTGLLDPGEDIPDAAARELMEETGLEATMDGILCFRQAHRPSGASDLFFVCHLTLKNPEQPWKACEDEIADIRWMSVEDYCGQERWQGSPTYETLNETIRKASQKAMNSKDNTVEGMIDSQILDVGLGFGGTNAVFQSNL